MDGDEAVFIDSSVLISCGRRESTRFQALAREATQRDTVFRIPPAVYAEVTDDPAVGAYMATGSPVDAAVQEGWMTVTDSPSYANSDVSAVMDQTRSFIANASNRSEDLVEKADTQIVGLALECLLTDTADSVTVVTNDIPLGDATASLIPQYGFDTQQVTWCTGGDFAAELDADFVSEFE
jgi:hypothetical protein